MSEQKSQTFSSSPNKHVPIVDTELAIQYAGDDGDSDVAGPSYASDTHNRRIPPRPETLTTKPNANDACATIVQHLMLYNLNKDEDFSRKACESLIKKMKDKRGELDALINAVTSLGGEVTPCVTIQRTLDGRLQVAGRKGFPHVVYAKIWRWPDLHKNELKHIVVCKCAFDLKCDVVCVNPYHYERVISPVINNLDLSSLKLDTNMGTDDDAMINVGDEGYSRKPAVILSPNSGYQPQGHRMDVDSQFAAPVLHSSWGHHHHPHAAHHFAQQQQQVQQQVQTQQPQQQQVHHPQQQQIPKAGMPPFSPQQTPFVGHNSFYTNPPANSMMQHQPPPGMTTTANPMFQQLGEGLEHVKQLHSNGLQQDHQQIQHHHQQQQQQHQQHVHQQLLQQQQQSLMNQQQLLPSTSAAVAPPPPPVNIDRFRMSEPPTAEVPSNWCAIAYHELDEQIGELRQITVNEVVIDGGFDVQSPHRVCIGAYTNINRTDETERVRQEVGEGVRLSVKNNGDVWLYTRGYQPVFVHSNYLDRESGRVPGDAIHKIYPGAVIKVFDLRQCHAQLKAQAAYQMMAREIKAGRHIPNEDTVKLDEESLNKAANIGVDDLRELCVIRISFIKGWGPDYSRETISEVPCWIEVQMNNALEILDRILHEPGVLSVGSEDD